ncbi:hypothetical protein KKE19_00185 [Patescibacteria group bacterium]|nr:hypothetical protein [Patescibacteria group bacterium]MBU4367319.1 hypothetical protein [Patescibacteria group bacterium]MBU4461656.1 hypothetical protein [Patescibacteria group bacterium]MCG2699706.1 hypothetical protein [Candidatus Parcubacteria bacterium]
MDFGIIYQLKTKKFWWLDVIFYFTVALLLATIICFVIFSIKISFQEKKLEDLQNTITTSTGTAQQKEEEKKVFEYQKKIDDFAAILAVHKAPTNILKFFEETTLPNVWFNNFSMNAQTAGIRINGETEDTVALSRQIAVFEQNQFVENVADLNFESTETGKTRFSLNLALDPNIFFLTTIEEIQPEEILETVSPSSSLFLNNNIF